MRLQAFLLAAREGFEPSQTESESVVLPLHNLAKRKNYYTASFDFVNTFFKNIFIDKSFFRDYIEHMNDCSFVIIFMQSGLVKGKNTKKQRTPEGIRCGSGQFRSVSQADGMGSKTLTP